MYYIVFYLAPGDYHRFHSPSKFILDRIIHIPGRLRKVGQSTVEKYHGIYCKNERVTLEGKSDLGNMWMVMVGALNVGSIKLKFMDKIQTNLFKK